jgi:hypothetical protein
LGGRNWGLWSRPSQAKKMWDHTWKITKAKRDGGMTQVVEHLPSKCKALSSTPSTAKNFLKRGENISIPVSVAEETHSGWMSMAFCPTSLGPWCCRCATICGSICEEGLEFRGRDSQVEIHSAVCYQTKWPVVGMIITTSPNPLFWFKWNTLQSTHTQCLWILLLKVPF